MNNNLNESSHAKCKCGKYATIAEWKARIGIHGNYQCPDCKHKDFLNQYKRNENSNK